MTLEASHEAPRGATLRRLAKTYLSRHTGGLIASLALSLAIASLTFLFMNRLQPAINALLVERTPGALWIFPPMIAAIGVARAAFQAIQLRLINRIGHTLVGEIQLDLFSRLIGADLIRLQGAHSGQHVSSMLFDANLVRDGSTTVALNYIQNLLITVAMFAYMLSKDIGLTVVTLTVAPFAFYVIRKFEGLTRRAAQGAMGETSNLSTVILEGLDGVKIVKIEGREDYERERVSQVVKRRQEFLIRGSNAKALSGPISEMLMMVIVAGILAYAGWRALGDKMDAATFTTFILALVQAAQSFRQLGPLQATMGESLTAAGRLFEALDIQPRIVDRPGAQPLKTGSSTIAFEHVTFAYGEEATGDTRRFVRGPSGRVRRPGRPSGGGKSTILNLIPRFYDVSTGGEDRRSGRARGDHAIAPQPHRPGVARALSV